MTTQKVKIDPGVLDRRDRRQRRRQTGRKVGMYGLVAIVVLLVTAAAVAVWRGERAADEVPLGLPSTGRAISGDDEPSATGPATGLAEPSSGALFSSFLPNDAEPSAPEHGKHGKLVMSAGGIHPGYHVHVYADGRVIWIRQTRSSDTGWLERRLTPEGLKLLRSGAVRLSGQFDDPGSKLPASAWEDLESEPYVPQRYAVCPGFGSGGAATTWRLLPRRARVLLRSTEQGYVHRCLVVTTEDALELDELRLEVEGFERSGGRGSLRTAFAIAPRSTSCSSFRTPRPQKQSCCLG